MLAKAEWERQLRAKLEQRERDRAEAMLEAAASPEEAPLAAEPKQSLKLGSPRLLLMISMGIVLMFKRDMLG